MEPSNHTPLLALSHGRGLSHAVARFARFLRSQGGIPVPLSAVVDAVRSLAFVDLSCLAELRDSLRPQFVSEKSHVARFDTLFDAFWSLDGAPPTIPPAGTTGEGGASPAGYPCDQPTEGRESGSDPRPGDGEASPGEPLRYSPHATAEKRPPRPMAAEGGVRLERTLAALLARLTRRISRRYELDSRGGKPSLRGLMRNNMELGGETVRLAFRRRRVKKRRVVVLCDISGSMDIYTLRVLQFVHAVTRVAPKTEVFTFSTELSRVTAAFGHRDFNKALAEMAIAATDWGGGTRIGHCLETFLHQYGGSRLTGRSVVIIYSDGWDRGEIDLLGRQMAALRRKACRVLWLNPLAGTRGYRPLCRGMREALPHVDYFLSATRLHDLVEIGAVLESLLVYA